MERLGDAGQQRHVGVEDEERLWTVVLGLVEASCQLSAIGG
jgi:hypothetical protein